MIMRYCFHAQRFLKEFNESLCHNLKPVLSQAAHGSIIENSNLCLLFLLKRFDMIAQNYGDSVRQLVKVE